MQSPFDSNKNLGSYVNLQKRMFEQVLSAKVNDQIIEVVQKIYEDTLMKENIALSRAEKKRLLFQVLRLVLEDMLKKFDDSSKSV